MFALGIGFVLAAVQLLLLYFTQQSAMTTRLDGAHDDHAPQFGYTSKSTTTEPHLRIAALIQSLLELRRALALVPRLGVPLFAPIACR